MHEKTDQLGMEHWAYIATCIRMKMHKDEKQLVKLKPPGDPGHNPTVFAQVQRRVEIGRVAYRAVKKAGEQLGREIVAKSREQP